MNIYRVFDNIECEALKLAPEEHASWCCEQQLGHLSSEVQCDCGMYEANVSVNNILQSVKELKESISQLLSFQSNREVEIDAAVKRAIEDTELSASAMDSLVYVLEQGLDLNGNMLGDALCEYRAAEVALKFLQGEDDGEEVSGNVERGDSDDHELQDSEGE